MLIITEGARHVTGIDLESGEVKWRFGARRAGTFRLRRAGKLVVVASGEQALSALDVVSGEVVWRSCDRLRFASPVTVEKDALYAIAGDGAYPGRGGTRLSHIDPWSGERRWSIDLPARAKPIGPPLSCNETVVVTTHDARGTGILGFDAETGAQIFEREACLGAAAALAIDDTVLLNSEAGEFVALDGKTGLVRYRHVFADGYEGDRPRRLDPVLRSGALFVPQTSVHVVRPGDGALLGAVQTDLVPDLVRVDERCDVIVAEESGHVSMFAVGPKLSVVR
jgi:outer membrane protein assembly factor BamB